MALNHRIMKREDRPGAISKLAAVAIHTPTIPVVPAKSQPIMMQSSSMLVISMMVCQPFFSFWPAHLLLTIHLFISVTSTIIEECFFL